MQDSDVIALYWARDEGAIPAAAGKYGSYCYAISYRILASHQDAEECVNDTWLAAWNSIPPQRPLRLGAYLGAIARNLSLNRYEQRHAQKRGGGQVELALSELSDCLSGGKTAEEAMEERELARAISGFLRGQSRERRAVFLRRYWYLHSIREIARDLGMTESRVTSLLYRMRRALKRHLEQEGVTL